VRITCLLFFLISKSFAWDAHILFTYLALSQMPELTATLVPAEPLDDFVKKEEHGLAQVLDDTERWAKKHVLLYAPTPAPLLFHHQSSSKPLRLRFLEALRVNPFLQYPLYIQYPPGKPHRIHQKPLEKTAVMLKKVTQSAWIVVLNPPLEGLKTNELVSPLEIITTASDEPDYGMDIDLWVDNPGPIGEIYGFGLQPFGDSRFSLGSQAPFHMGFFYEAPIVYKLSELDRTYPEYRIRLYLSLAKYALKTGHPYWGYRFLGWALHYVQDLSQPYHSTAAPGVSNPKLVLYGALDLIGIDKPRERLVQLISNRHFSLENYAYHFLEAALKSANDVTNQANLVIRALADSAADKRYPKYNDEYPRKVVAKESHAMAAEIDEDIRNAFPAKYVQDPNYIFYTTEVIPPNLYQMLKAHKSHAVDKLNAKLSRLFKALGAHTRNVVRYVLDDPAR
jgi:hypothetical protein